MQYRNIHSLKPNFMKKERSNRFKGLVILLFATIAVFISACGEDDETDSSLDYDTSSNWVSKPTPEKDVDVFYVYPTVSSNETGAMDIENVDERALAQGIYKAQASVFQASANVFAPYYRQMSTNVDMTGVALATDTEEFKQGAVDVQDAFEYFVENLNNDRPFIIAGHSQGTMALIELIKDKFGDDQALRERLVAAYLIGYTITDDDLDKANLTAAQSATDIGVVITFNTQSLSSEGGPMLLDGAHCINPLNWRTDGQEADSTENLGAVFFDDATGEFIREVPNYCNAKILDNGGLGATIPTQDADTLVFGPYNPGVYHRFDYSFWYRNIEKNVEDRIEAYLSRK